VLPEGLGKLKKIALLGIEPTTFLFVAKCINQYAIALSLLLATKLPAVGTIPHRPVTGRRGP
jgi:hypothetical protein